MTGTGIWWPAVWGATRYEFRMQVRRRGLWVTLALLGGLVLTDLLTGQNFTRDMSVAFVAGNWAMVVNAILCLGVGILLADRLTRDRRINVVELFGTLPAPGGGRLCGKFLGATLATAVPVALVYGAGLVAVTLRWGDPRAIPLGLAAFATVILPGLLFVGALSVSGPAFVWGPLYQFLFVFYWFWGNLLAPNMLGPRSQLPTPSATWITPLGGNAAGGFFGVYWFRRATALDGVLSVTLLLLCAALILVGTQGYLQRRQTGQ